MELEECRREIDKLDRELTDILERRMKLVAQVAEYKKIHHMEIYDPRREQQVLDKIAGLAGHKALAPYLRNIYQCIMDESKNYEREHMDR
ncbi:chorismate mutase [Megasphaera cerevisiae DSM 20462]|jgi:monofunctional chorismate mutase|uniref:Chorismate mutase n=1 Tax=Megasphaera cerevisiae DSM 20462 TaxID=1122219 RepID=A0A0J6WRW8_9FIRM|nr:chorismate mutase [Megasphaera cerevisiae]KMO86235.1 chorismate mutase [Megasphaera cerevisiae DSM 20462]MCI1750327.1 chorismate mutase [Megasphaera cerevisiae]OKY53834.1 chorismate mutase [Megasphaera cerevisiae]SKA02643.1 chorismate mutase [Megasphaera cerevisiae DSM 20462]